MRTLGFLRLFNGTAKFAIVSALALCTLGCAATVSYAAGVTLAWDPSNDPAAAGYKVYYGTSSQTYLTSVDAGSALTVTIDSLVAGNTYYFAATAYNDQGMEGPFSNEISYTLAPSTPTNPTVNAAPTLNPIADVTFEENAAPQTIPLEAITAGPKESQPLTVTAVPSDPSLISKITVDYTSPATTGSLVVTPAPNVFGTCLVTVTVDDGQTASHSVSQTFQVTITPVNQPPTLNPIENLTLSENAGMQLIMLTGISSGAANEAQTITVSATSSSPSIIPNPSVGYASPNSIANVAFTPVANAFGSATITVVVSDGVATTSQSFVVTISHVNTPPTLDALNNVVVDENAGEQTVPLSGITSGNPNEDQTLAVTATSSNPELVPAPAVSYSSPNPNGSLIFSPAKDANGSSTITVVVSDGESTISSSFVVTVNSVNQAPTLNAIGDVSLDANAAAQVVHLAGISSGSVNEAQTLSVTAVSSNPALIPNPTIAYTSPNGIADLTFKPAASASGSANITVTVNDGQDSFSRTFAVTVRQPNQPPSMAPLSNLVINENSGQQTVALTGISVGGAGESDVLVVTADSSNPSLVQNLNVTYTSPNTTGTLTFTPAANVSGDAIVTVSINDGLATVSTSFKLTVNHVNVPPTLDPLPSLVLARNAGQQSVSLSGISSGSSAENQSLTVSADSSNPSLVQNLNVTYTSPSTTGTLTFTPAANVSGDATVTVSVNDGLATVSTSFKVTVNHVNVPPTLDPLPSLVLARNAGQQSVSLSGISSGSSAEDQSLTVTAVSSNPSLIPNPVIDYTSPNGSGVLKFTPANGSLGTANVTVTVSDGENSTSQAFAVTIKRKAATLDLITDVSVVQNSGQQVVPLAISAEPDDVLTISAVSSDPELVPDPVVSYDSAQGTGSLVFQPVPERYGSATVSVTLQGSLEGDSPVTRTFNISVNSLTLEVGVGEVVIQAGQTGRLPLNFSSSIPVSSLSFTIQVPAMSLSNVTLEVVSPALDPAASQLVWNTEGNLVVHMSTFAGQTLTGSGVIANLVVAAPERHPSAFIPVRMPQFSASSRSATSAGNQTGHAGRIVVIAEQPLLELGNHPDGTRGLKLYGTPGGTYAVEYATGLQGETWQALPALYYLNQGSAPIEVVPPTGSQVFYRAVKQ